MQWIRLPPSLLLPPKGRRGCSRSLSGRVLFISPLLFVSVHLPPLHNRKYGFERSHLLACHSLCLRLSYCCTSLRPKRCQTVAPVLSPAIHVFSKAARIQHWKICRYHPRFGSLWRRSIRCHFLPTNRLHRSRDTEEVIQDWHCRHNLLTLHTHSSRLSACLRCCCRPDMGDGRL